MSSHKSEGSKEEIGSMVGRGRVQSRMRDDDISCHSCRYFKSGIVYAFNPLHKIGKSLRRPAGWVEHGVRLRTKCLGPELAKLPMLTASWSLTYLTTAHDSRLFAWAWKNMGKYQNAEFTLQPDQLQMYRAATT